MADLQPTNSRIEHWLQEYFHISRDVRWSASLDSLFARVQLEDGPEVAEEFRQCLIFLQQVRDRP